MHVLRAFLARHRAFAAIIIAAALCMKALVPAGFMIDGGAKVLTIHICADSLGHVVTRQIAIPQSGHGDDSKKAHADSPCAFSALGHAVIGGADPIQLALALLFILGLGFAPLTAPRLQPVFHLRPPLRGPPAQA